MDRYLSTYRKDFLWPCVRTFPIRVLSETYPEKVLTCKSADNGRAPCTCGPETGGLTASKENSGPPVDEAHQWNHLGPTAPLPDPKLHPGKMGPALEIEIPQYDQSSTYLKKLQEKYPYLYKILQSAPSNYMTRCVNQDRLRTTYQVDYSHMDEHRDYEKVLAKAGIHSERINKTVPYDIGPPDYSDTTTNCPGRFENLREGVNDPVEFGGTFQEDTNYRDGIRYDARGFQDSREAVTNYIEPLEHDSGRAPREFGHSREAAKEKYDFKDESAESGRDAHENYQEAANIQKGESGERAARIIKSGDGVKAFVRSIENKKEEGKGLPAWRSEYQEVIGQTGYDIMRDKIHRHEARSRGRSLIERIIMRCRAL